MTAAANGPSWGEGRVFTVTDDPASWRALFSAATAGGWDVEMAEPTVDVLRSFGQPPNDTERPPGFVGRIGDMGPAVYANPDLAPGQVRLRARPR